MEWNVVYHPFLQFRVKSTLKIFNGESNLSILEVLTDWLCLSLGNALTVGLPLADSGRGLRISHSPSTLKISSHDYILASLFTQFSINQTFLF